MTGIRVALVVLALLLVAVVAWVATRKPEIVVRTETRTIVRTVGVSAPHPGGTAPAGPTPEAAPPADDPWRAQRGDLAFVLGMEAGLARAKAARKGIFLFYTQHG